MNNEPVAWMVSNALGNTYFEKDRGKLPYILYENAMPLYTHQSETITLAELRQTELYRKEQTRHLRELLEPNELTDEEIQKAIDGIDWNQSNVLIRFARAILRKVQENG
jgi:hypothetical protein